MKKEKATLTHSRLSCGQSYIPIRLHHLVTATIGLLIFGTYCLALESMEPSHVSSISDKTAYKTTTIQRDFQPISWHNNRKNKTLLPALLLDRLYPVLASLPSPQDGYPRKALQLMAEGQRLMMLQTRQGYSDALAKFKDAFAAYQSENFKWGLGGARFWEGIAYDSLRKPELALAAFLDTERLQNETGMGWMNPMIFAVIGSKYAEFGNTVKALDYLNRALPPLLKLGDPRFAAYAYKGLGYVYVQIGQKRKGLEYLDQAVKLYQKSEDWLQEVQILNLISALKSSLGQSTEAIDLANAAIKRSQEKNSSDWEAYGRFALGAAHSAAGNLGQAVTEYTRSLELLKGQDDCSGEATALNNLGLIYLARSESDLALNSFEKALNLAKSDSNSKMESYILNNIGTIYYRRGEPLKALRNFEVALAIAVRIDDKRLKASVNTNMADAYFTVNSPEYAINLLTETAAIFREIEEPVHETEALISLADAYGATNRFQKALDIMRKALESRRLAEDPARQGYILREIGYIYNLMGDHDQAQTYFLQALSQLEAAQDTSGQIELYTAMAANSVSHQDYRKAEELFIKGLALAHSNGLRQNESLILAGLGSLHAKQGNLAQAESFYDRQIVVSESLLRTARIEELKTQASNVSASLLAPVIFFKFQIGKWSEAFELAERARARTFLDQLNNAHIDIRKGSDPQLAEQEQMIRFDISVLEEKLRKEFKSNPSSDTYKLLSANLKQEKEDYAALLIRLKASNPDYAELQSYSPVSVSQIQQLLDPQTTMISYFVTSDRTLAFVLRSNSLQAVELPVKQADLRTAINWFREFPSRWDTKPKSLEQLNNWLLAPVQAYIKTNKVVIIPNGILHYVPFAALTDSSGYFGDTHAISYLPSASTLLHLRRRIRNNGGRVFTLAQAQAPGFAFLSHVDEEAKSVARLYRSQPHLSGTLTKAEFMKQAGDYNMLHIAAHAELNTTSPLFSRIHLASGKNDNGALEVREIYGMDLSKTNLVTLSACETQMGTQSTGDDIVGLNRAFIYAGASAVVASLWTVDDEATSLLMKAVYSHLRQGRSKAAALQAAQIEIRKKYPHPYYWSAFVLTGDPGKNNKR
jgi:CHAT domain-containing protein/Flp pilus assembly protein TadD